MFQYLHSCRRENKRRIRETKRRRLSTEPLEVRRLLAASLGWDGPGQSSAELTYYIANSPSSLSQAETVAAIESALDVWSSAADITFTQTSQSGLSDSIDISFTSIDGVGGTLAQAYFPDDVNPTRIAGDIQFDISDAWEVGDALGSQAFDLIYVAVHEIGHSLGLDHTGSLDSVLAPFVSPNQFFSSLASVDVAAIQELYAAADDATTTDTPVVDVPVDDTPTDETPIDENETDNSSDTDDDPFARRRWRRGGNWLRWGGRLDAVSLEYNYVNPTDVNSDGSTSVLDALMVINQLDRGASDDDVDVAGLCDANGDGVITALDALTVINAMNNRSVAATTVDGADSTEVTDDAENAAEDTATTVSDVDDTTVTTEAVGDTVDPAEEVDDTPNDADDTTDLVDEVDDTEETDSTGDTEDTIDDGGTLDDTGDDTDCHIGGHHHSGRFNVGLFGKDAETLITRYDTNDDGSLSEDEVSQRLWAKLTELEVDGDADGLVTLAELETAVTAARQEAFNERDTDGDGLLVETEVSERLWTKISGADADADGGVSFDELDTFFAEQTTEFVAAGGGSHHHRSVDQAFAQLGRSENRGLLALSRRR